MKYPDTDSSKTSISKKIEPSNEDTDNETYEVWPRQTHPIPPSGFNRTAIVQQNVKKKIIYENEQEEKINHIELRIPAGIETTQPKRGRSRTKKSVNDVQTTQSKKRAASNNDQIDAEHVLKSINKRRKN
ncbi:hypothetical protein BpHYR1_040139 [Brachionus plicatilis]|uniref:Uncharacterized protein n=1 Tax=Brachionus plicatilis TaxID=10195 RepID=A0A3M7SCN1_BRAPC|nr:hypothetical protein BpHYR1_040139 [Brachionus plicatilis]